MVTGSDGSEVMAGLSDDDALALLDLSSQRIARVALSGEVVWCNQAFAASPGWERGRGSQQPPTPKVSTVIPEWPARTKGTLLLTGAPAEGTIPRWRVREADATDGSVWIVENALQELDGSATAHSTQRVLQTVLDNSFAAIFAKDMDHRFMLVNRAFSELVGLDPEEVLGRNADEIGPTAALSLVDESVEAQALDDRVPADGIIDSVDGTGARTTRLFALLDAVGNKVGVAGIYTDQSEQAVVDAAYRQREQMLETIVRASPDVVTLLDLSGEVVAVSEASWKILGLSSDVQVSDLTDRVHPNDRPRVNLAYRELLNGEVDQTELRYRVRHQAGHWVILDTRGRPIVDSDGQRQGAVVVSRDITGEVELEEQLYRAVKLAEQASAAKSEFLSRMSHELRTPLNSVLGFAQLLYMDGLPTTQHASVGHILRAGRHLLNLIDEVLDIARIETGNVELSLESVPVDAVVRDAVDLTAPLAERNSVAVVVGGAGPGAWVLADRQRFLQVLLNLLSNAVKYNRSGGWVEVVVRQEGEIVVLKVSDTGPGIPPERLDRLFEPFDRLGAETSGVEGTGVGLTLSKQLVERMGGTIWVDSEPGGGSIFSVSLPASEPAPSVSKNEAVTATVGSGGWLRVLHVEDNLANLELVEQILLRRGGVELLAAMHGRLAVDLAQEHRPDLVLLDMQLPDLSGDEVLDRLRSNPDTADIPVVVVSAGATAEQKRRLSHLGVMAFLTKPIDVNQLLELIESVAANSSGQVAGGRATIGATYHRGISPVISDHGQGEFGGDSPDLFPQDQDPASAGLSTDAAADRGADVRNSRGRGRDWRGRR